MFGNLVSLTFNVYSVGWLGSGGNGREKGKGGSVNATKLQI